MDLFNDLAREAHDSCTVDGCFATRDVAVEFVDQLTALLPSGNVEVELFLERMTVDGASKWLNDWRRKSMTPARTKTGAIVDLPRYAGMRDGEGEHKQMALFEMDVDTLTAHRLKLGKARNTLSREIAVLDALIAAMQEDNSLKTAGDAFRKLGLAA